jgi:hypothetical protein
VGRPVGRRKGRPVKAEAIVRYGPAGTRVREHQTPRVSQEDIQMRAVEISEAKGESGDLTLDDWLEAECDLLVWESLMVRS